MHLPLPLGGEERGTGRKRDGHGTGGRRGDWQRLSAHAGRKPALEPGARGWQRRRHAGRQEAVDSFQTGGEVDCSGYNRRGGRRHRWTGGDDGTGGGCHLTLRCRSGTRSSASRGGWQRGRSCCIRWAAGRACTGARDAGCRTARRKQVGIRRPDRGSSNTGSLGSRCSLPRRTEASRGHRRSGWIIPLQSFVVLRLAIGIAEALPGQLDFRQQARLQLPIAMASLRADPLDYRRGSTGYCLRIDRRQRPQTQKLVVVRRAIRLPAKQFAVEVAGGRHRSAILREGIGSPSDRHTSLPPARGDMLRDPNVTAAVPLYDCPLAYAVTW